MIGLGIFGGWYFVSSNCIKLIYLELFVLLVSMNFIILHMIFELFVCYY